MADDRRRRYLLQAVAENRVRVDCLGACKLDGSEPVTSQIKALERRGLVEIPRRVAQGGSRLVRVTRAAAIHGESS